MSPLAFLSPLVFLDRSRRAEGYPWLVWKVRFFVIGAALAVGGMVLEMDWIVGLAIVVLALGFLVRFLPGGQGVRSEEEEEALSSWGWGGNDEEEDWEDLEDDLPDEGR
jgi:hypothetical protein